MPDWVFYGAVIGLLTIWGVSRKLNIRAQMEAEDADWEAVVHKNRTK